MGFAITTKEKDMIVFNLGYNKFLIDDCYLDSVADILKDASPYQRNTKMAKSCIKEIISIHLIHLLHSSMTLK